MRASLVLAVLLLPFLAGCAGKDATPQSVPVTSTQVGFGDIEGLVTDGEFRPVVGAQVSLRGAADERDAVTDETGAFVFDSVTASAYVVTIFHPRYEPSKEFVTVAKGFTEKLEVALALLPENRPYTVILNSMRGHYECGLEFVILTGDCMILWENVTKTPSPVTTYKNHVTFNVTRGWSTVLLQLSYSSASNNQLDGMRFYVAPANESRDPAAHHTKLAVAEGNANPLEVRMVSGIAHETADEWKPGGAKAQLSPKGGELMGLVYPRGHAADVTGTVCQPDDPDRCLLGVGLGLAVDFTVDVAIFYNGQAVPDGFDFA